MSSLNLTDTAQLARLKDSAFLKVALGDRRIRMLLGQVGTKLMEENRLGYAVDDSIRGVCRALLSALHEARYIVITPDTDSVVNFRYEETKDYVSEEAFDAAELELGSLINGHYQDLLTSCHQSVRPIATQR